MEPAATSKSHSSATSPAAPGNRLANEKSPYLLQHARNPVDWYPWGAEAFEKARRERKPIFLSIGYSTCHWCHVMERESFENEKLAALLNAHYVSIKVDREERPDVDRIYMSFVQATTGSGGWPMSVFLTPDLKPFYGGTYFPPEQKHGRPGFPQLIEHIHRLWETRHDELVNSAEQVHAQMQQLAGGNETPSGVGLGPEAIQNAGALLKKFYDARHGGFGGAPKFPQPSQPQLMLQYGRRFNDDEAVRMVLHTCDRMARGGIYDHLGGGFARYSVDAQWLVPHFEKMLYDNAQLVHLYLEAWLLSGEPRHLEVVRGTLDYVLRDMTHPDGGFWSAEDADSEGHEGKFYCWTTGELEKLLSPEEYTVATRYFGITKEGNFVDHSHPSPLPNQNVLSIVEPAVAADAEGQRLLNSAIEKMRRVRATRVRPHRDDKVLVSWNGLMLGAFARASVVLNDARYRAAAEQNAAFVRERMWQPARPGAAESGASEVLNVSAEETGAAGTLYHRWRDGERDSVQLLEAYAFWLHGLVGLYEATVQTAHLEFAIEVAGAMLARFYDAENGGFWQSTARAQDLIVRVKEAYDGAEPSGNSVAILALLRLGAITGRPEFTAAATKSLRLFSTRLQEMPQAVTFMMQALDMSLQEPDRAVVAGDPSSAATRELISALHSRYHPNGVILGNSGPVDEFSRTLKTTDAPSVYVCTGATCRPPIRDARELSEAW